MTSDALACAHWTRLAWMIAGNPACGTALGQMAGQALAIIRNGITHQRSMRVVASHAGKTCIAFSPASALLQPVGLKPDVRHTACIGQRHVPCCPVACTAEIYRVDGIKMRRIQDGLRPEFDLFASLCSRMSSSWPMTGFTCNARNQAGHIKVAAGRGSCSMASETLPGFGSRHGPPKRPGNISRNRSTMAQSEVQRLQCGIKAYAAFIEGSISLENVCLPHLSCSKCKAKRLRKRILAIAYRIQKLFPGF